MRHSGGFKPDRHTPGTYKPRSGENKRSLEMLRERIKGSQAERTAAREALEEKKDRTNLKRELDFVGNHREAYRAHAEKFFEKPEYPESRAFCEGLTFPNYDAEKAQISPDEIKSIIARIPPHIVARSSLKEIDYSWQDSLPVPAFDAEGNLDFSKIEILTKEEFAASKHHKERALIGYTSSSTDTNEAGKTEYSTLIRPTHIPEGVSNDPELVQYYQMHVMMHEFFHTVEMPLRSQEAAKEWVINKMTGRTFADWVQDYTKAVADEKIPSSHYASVYADDIFQGGKEPVPYSYPVVEWMCEDWVGTVFGVVPNSAGDTDFAARRLTTAPANPPVSPPELVAGGLSHQPAPANIYSSGIVDVNKLRRDMSGVGSRRHELLQELLTPEYTPDIREPFVEAIQAYVREFGVPAQVCYPGSGTEVSLPAALPGESHITFVDPDELSIRKLQTYEQSPRFSAVAARAEDYVPPEPLDLVFDSSSSVGKHMVPYLKVGGHLMHERTYSSWAFDEHSLKLVGVVLDEDSKTIVRDEAIVNEYREPHPDWERAGYDDATFMKMGHSYWGNNRAKKAAWYVFEKVTK